MMFQGADLDSLCSFGYTARQAQWLRLVMIHAGTFLRRQFVAFLGAAKSGALDQRLLSSLLRAGHAQVLPYHGRERMYHIRARRMYAAIGHEHSRHRRAMPAHVAAQGLLVLDFMAAEPWPYFESEADKVRCFTERFGVPRGHLPQRIYRSNTDPARTTIRYFVERYPIVDEPDLVRFVVPDLAPRAAAAFAAFLTDYRLLLQAVPRAEIVYLTAQRESPKAAQRLYHDACGSSRAVSNDIADIEALNRYFGTRRALEQREYGRLDAEALDRHVEDARRFATPPYERLYHDWMRGGIIALTRAINAEPLATPRITFRHVALPYRYYCLGIVTRFAARPSAQRRYMS